LAASAGGMSGGLRTMKLHSLGASLASCGRITGVMPASFMTFCEMMLWIEYQKGTANCLPPKSLGELMPESLPTTMPEPLVWFQAVILIGNLLL
jgi:hypothetical protein